MPAGPLLASRHCFGCAASHEAARCLAGFVAVLKSSTEACGGSPSNSPFCRRQRRRHMCLPSLYGACKGMLSGSYICCRGQQQQRQLWACTFKG